MKTLLLLAATFIAHGKPLPNLRPEAVQLADFHVTQVAFPPDKVIK